MAKKAKVNLPVKVKEMTMLQAISSFNEHEQKLYKELADYIRKHNRESVNWYWDLGTKLVHVRDDAKKNKEHYGNGILDRMCAALGFKTSGPLYSAMRVVEAFGTKKSFTEYTKLAGEAGNTLTWGHIVKLSGIPDAEIRMDLAAAALEQAWTVDILHEQVKKLVERKSRGIRKATPKAKIPGSVKKCFQHVSTRAEEFIYQYKTAWTGDAFNLMGAIEDLPASSINDKLLSELVATRAHIAELIESAQQMDAELQNADSVMRRKLAAQIAADEAAEMAAAAAEIEDAEPDAYEEEEEEEEEEYEDAEPEAEELDEESDDDYVTHIVETDEDVEEDAESDIDSSPKRNSILRQAVAIARARERASKIRSH